MKGPTAVVRIILLLLVTNTNITNQELNDDSFTSQFFDRGKASVALTNGTFTEVSLSLTSTLFGDESPVIRLTEEEINDVDYLLIAVVEIDTEGEFMMNFTADVYNVEEMTNEILETEVVISYYDYIDELQLKPIFWRLNVITTVVFHILLHYPVNGVVPISKCQVKGTWFYNGVPVGTERNYHAIQNMNDQYYVTGSFNLRKVIVPLSLEYFTLTCTGSVRKAVTFYREEEENRLELLHINVTNSSNNSTVWKDILSDHDDITCLGIPETAPEEVILSASLYSTYPIYGVYLKGTYDGATLSISKDGQLVHDGETMGTKLNSDEEYLFRNESGFRTPIYGDSVIVKLKDYSLELKFCSLIVDSRPISIDFHEVPDSSNKAVYGELTTNTITVYINPLLHLREPKVFFGFESEGHNITSSPSKVVITPPAGRHYLKVKEKTVSTGEYIFGNGKTYFEVLYAPGNITYIGNDVIVPENKSLLFAWTFDHGDNMTISITNDILKIDNMLVVSELESVGDLFVIVTMVRIEREYYVPSSLSIRANNQFNSSTYDYNFDSFSSVFDMNVTFLECEIPSYECYFEITIYSLFESTCIIMDETGNEFLSFSYVNSLTGGNSNKSFFYISVPGLLTTGNLSFNCSDQSGFRVHLLSGLFQDLEHVDVSGLMTSYNATNSELLFWYDIFENVDITYVVFYHSPVMTILFKEEIINSSTPGNPLKFNQTDTSNIVFVASFVYSNNDTFMVMNRTLTLPQIHLSSLKKYFINDEFTGLYDSSFDISSKVIFNSVVDEIYMYDWTLTPANFMTTPINSDSITAQYPPGCYQWYLEITSSISYPANISTSFCTEGKTNATYHVNTGQTIGTASVFTIDVFNLGPHTCIFLDIDDPNVSHLFGFYSQEEDLNQTIDWCLQKELTGKRVEWITFQELSLSSSLRNVTLIHIYQDLGLHNTTLHIYNRVHREVVNRSVNVVPIICNSPLVKLIGLGINEDNPIKLYRSKKFKIETLYKIDCETSSVINTTWTIYKGYLFDEEFKSHNLKTKETTVFTILPTELPAGSYKICIKIAMVVHEAFSETDCRYLLMEDTPLVAIINGGDQVKRSYSFDYTIDASKSNDPDTKTLQDTEMYFLCRDLNDLKFNLTYETVVHMDIVTSSFISPSQPTFIDAGGCFGTGPGRLHTNTNAATKFLQSENLVHNKMLEITVFLWKNGTIPRMSSYQQLLLITPSTPPSIEIQCFENCEEIVNFNEEHSYTGGCGANGECEGEIIFEWYLSKCEEKLTNCTDVSEEEFTKIRSTAKHILNYNAHGGVYDPNNWYMLGLRGYKSEFIYGESAVSFYVNEPPKNGWCSINPDEGIVIMDEHKIECYDWTDLHLPLRYKFFLLEESLEIILYDGLLSDYNVYLPLGVAKNDYNLTVYMTIMDNLRGQVTVSNVVKINPPPDIEEAIYNITESVKDENSILNTYARSKDVMKLSNVILLFTSLMNDWSDSFVYESDSSNSTNSTNTTTTDNGDEKLQNNTMALVKLRDALYNKLNDVTPESMDDVRFITGIYASVSAYPNQISYHQQNIIVEKCDTFIDVMKQDTEVASTKDTLSALAGSTYILGNIIDVSGNTLDVLNPNNSKMEVIKSLASDRNISDQSNEQIVVANKLLSRLIAICGTLALPGGHPQTVITRSVSLAAGKVWPTENAHVEVNGVKAKFNASKYASNGRGMDAAKAFVSVKLKNTKSNYLLMDKSSANVKSELTSVNLELMDGMEINVTNSAEPFEIIVKNKVDLNATQAQIVAMEVDNDGNQWSFHLIEIKNKSFQAIIKPLNQSLPLTAYLRKEKRPTVYKYDYTWSLPDHSTCEWLNGSLNEDEELDILIAFEDEYTCRINPRSIFVGDDAYLDGVYYLGIYYNVTYHVDINTKLRKKRKKRSIYYDNYDDDFEELSFDNDDNHDSRRSRRAATPFDVSLVDEEFCVVILPPPPTPPPTDPPGSWEVVMPTITNDSIEYEISFSAAKCLFWNETEKSWGSNGCTVGPESTPEKTQCLCTHLTDFGGDVLVAPNPIDFSKVFAGLKNLADNLGVLLVILTIVLIYILLVIWARKKDRKDEEDRGIVTIDCRTGPGKGSSYLATIVTGSGNNAGTSASVYCILLGAKGKSKVIPLKVDGRKFLQSRSITTYKFILPNDLGDLDCIRVFHNNAGKSPSWYLRNIIVTDLSTKKLYPFVCDSWLAVESDDGEIDKVLPIASEKELAGFHIVFASTAAQGLLDGHIWLSIFTRPKQSTFTRVQRLSCCLLLIFLTMITNAMFFGAGDAPGAKKTLRLGNVIIDLTGIIIGIEASLIVIPPSMLVIEIFRRLRPKKKKKKQDMKYEEETLNCDNKLTNAYPAKTESKEKGPFMFPNNLKYLAYAIVGLGSFGSALFTFFYSMMWGKEKSNNWLQSMFFGFFQSVLVIQPIKAVFVAILFAIFLRKPVEQDHNVDENDESVTEGDENVGGEDGVISADEIPIVKPSESTIYRARKNKLKEKMTVQIIKDIVMYLIFLLVVSKLAYSERDPNMFGYRRDLYNMLYKGTYTDGLPLNLVSDPHLLYSWLRDTLIPSLFSGPWYNEDFPKESGFTESHESLMISIPRLRQQRVEQMSCKIHSSMQGIIDHCESGYSFGNEEKGTYTTRWLPFNTTHRNRRAAIWTVDKNIKDNSNSRSRRNTDDQSQVGTYEVMVPGKEGSLRRRRKKKGSASAGNVYYVTPEALLPDGSVISCRDRWEHFTSSQLKGFPFFGRLVTYSGGGYIANLGYNEETGWTVIADLHAHNWLDRQTRAVFVEFTVYNANINLFASAFLFIEVLPTGGAFPHADFKVFNGYRYALNSHVASRLTELFFVILVIYFTVLEIKKMVKQKRQYLKGFFNLIEIILLPLYFAMFGLIIFRWLSTAKNIRQFKENPKDFVSFQYSAEADSLLQGVIGVVAFLLNIKFLKYFQFTRSFYSIGLVMKSFIEPLANYSIAFGIGYFSFAISAHLAFSTMSESYMTVTRAVIAQALHLLGTTDFENVSDAHPILGPMYYVFYSTFMMFILFNVFMAIICESIGDDYEEEFERSIGDLKIIEFMIWRLKQIVTLSDDEGSFYQTADIDKEDPHTLMDIQMTKLEESVDRMFCRIVAMSRSVSDDYSSVHILDDIEPHDNDVDHESGNNENITSSKESTQQNLDILTTKDYDTNLDTGTIDTDSDIEIIDIDSQIQTMAKDYIVKGEKH